MPAHRQVPDYQIARFLPKTHQYCVVVPVINEGDRLGALLRRMDSLGIADRADIVIADGGSTDGSTRAEALRSAHVSVLLTKTGPGRLSAQLRCAYDFALDEGYAGIVTIDGNNKDDPAAIPSFLGELQDGIDFVQASRFLPGGSAENTPRSRDLAIRLVHAPVLSISSGFHWTDTTQGFRAYSARLLLDPRVAPFRDVFMDYELLAYLSHRAPRLGYACKEIPTARHYPRGEVPTKISGVRGNLRLLLTLFRAAAGSYNPRSDPR